MKIHVCKCCGNKSFLVSVPVVQEWQVDADGVYVHCLDKSIRPLKHPTDEDIWECPECGNRCQGKDILVEGAKTISFIDLEEGLIVYAEIVKRDNECITISPFAVHTAHKDVYPPLSAYNQQTFNICYEEHDVLCTKDMFGAPHFWTKVQYCYHTKEEINYFRKDNLGKLKAKLFQ